MSEPQDPDGFLARWSRRKRAAEAEPLAQAEPEPEPVAEAPLVQVLRPAPQACPIPGIPEIDLASLPKLEDLTQGSDFAPFLRPGIPSTLRSAALRRMWSLDPAIRDFIGPADYAWDYNDPAGMPGGFGLDIGSEVKKLLAQAIGETETPRPESPVAPDAPAAQELPMQQPSMVAQVGEPAPVHAVSQDETHEAGLPSRRHGGAMPA